MVKKNKCGTNDMSKKKPFFFPSDQTNDGSIVEIIFKSTLGIRFRRNV